MSKTVSWKNWQFKEGDVRGVWKPQNSIKIIKNRNTAWKFTKILKPQLQMCYGAVIITSSSPSIRNMTLFRLIKVYVNVNQRMIITLIKYCKNRHTSVGLTSLCCCGTNISALAHALILPSYPIETHRCLQLQHWKPVECYTTQAFRNFNVWWKFVKMLVFKLKYPEYELRTSILCRNSTESTLHLNSNFPRRILNDPKTTQSAPYIHTYFIVTSPWSVQ